jgi:hypothetical protein
VIKLHEPLMVLGHKRPIRPTMDKMRRGIAASTGSIDGCIGEDSVSTPSGKGLRVNLIFRHTFSEVHDLRSPAAGVDVKRTFRIAR